MLTFSASGRVVAKIGVSKDPQKRAIGVQTGCPFLIMGCYASEFKNRRLAMAAEREAHDRLFRFRSVGEWFSFPLAEADALFFAVDDVLNECSGHPLAPVSITRMATTSFDAVASRPLRD